MQIYSGAWMPWCSSERSPWQCPHKISVNIQVGGGGRKRETLLNCGHTRPRRIPVTCSYLIPLFCVYECDHQHKYTNHKYSDPISVLRFEESLLCDPIWIYTNQSSLLWRWCGGLAKPTSTSHACSTPEQHCTVTSSMAMSPSWICQLCVVVVPLK